MMKDQFANYVVQKVLETCDDQQREMILTRIKTHLNTLKKYTYGKHIVARVEKLVAAGGIYGVPLCLQCFTLCVYILGLICIFLLYSQRSDLGFNQHALLPEGQTI